MKPTIFIIVVIGLYSCNQHSNRMQVLQNRIDSLENKLAETYKPGFGEFMSNIQAHHAKLWFAGLNQNWKLADFEVHEIMESIEDIQIYQKERKESEMIGIINPALDSVNIAIQKKNPEQFKNSFTSLTNTCNECHRIADFEFNVVKIPDVQTFSNQVFETQ